MSRASEPSGLRGRIVLVTYVLTVQIAHGKLDELVNWRILCPRMSISALPVSIASISAGPLSLPMILNRVLSAVQRPGNSFLISQHSTGWVVPLAASKGPVVQRDYLCYLRNPSGMATNSELFWERGIKLSWPQCFQGLNS